MDATRKRTAAVRMLQTTSGLHTDPIQILIAPRIYKPFTENSSSLIFARSTHKHFTSVICRDPAVHPAMYNWGLRMNEQHSLAKIAKINIWYFFHYK